MGDQISGKSSTQLLKEYAGLSREGMQEKLKFHAMKSELEDTGIVRFHGVMVDELSNMIKQKTPQDPNVIEQDVPSFLQGYKSSGSGSEMLSDAPLDPEMQAALEASRATGGSIGKR